MSVFESTGFSFLCPCIYAVMILKIFHLDIIIIEVTSLWSLTGLISYLHSFFTTATVKF